MKPDPAVVPWNVCQWLQEELENHSVDVASIALLDAEEIPEAWTLSNRENPFVWLSDERFSELADWLIQEVNEGVAALFHRLAYIAETWGFLQIKVGVCPSCRRIGHGNSHPGWSALHS